jgi:hypothetical protein
MRRRATSRSVVCAPLDAVADGRPSTDFRCLVHRIDVESMYHAAIF